MKRIVKRVMGGCGAMIFVLALIVGGLGARLAIAPVSLGFLADSLNSQVNGLMPGLDIRFREASLVWRPETARIDLVFSAVSMGNAATGTRIEIPSLQVRIKTTALLAGRLEPTEIHVTRPQFSVEWSIDALTQMTPRETDASPKPLSDAIRLPPRLRRLIDDLVQPAEATPLASLSVVHLEDAGITLTETLSGLTWRIPEADIDLMRRPQGVVLDIDGRLLPPPGVTADGTRISVSGLLSAAAQPDSLSIRLTAFRPDGFLGELPALSELSGIDLPLDILLAISLTGDAGPPDIGLAISSAGGEIDAPSLYSGPRRLGALDIQTRFAPADRELHIDRASLRLDDATLNWRGTLSLDETGEVTAIDTRAGISRIGLRELLHYWPDDLARGAWRWMNESMPGAQLANLDARYVAAGPTLVTESFRVTFDIQEAEADILPPAPPLLKASGHAVLTERELAIDLESGTIDGLSVAGSRVVLEGLDSPDVQYGDVTLRMSESLPDILRLIDHPPLGYASAFGIAPDDLRGAAKVIAKLRFPLLADLPLTDIDIDIRANIDDLAVPDLYDGAGLEQGSMILSVTGEHLEGRGQGVFMDIPLDFRWNENFDPADGALPSRYEIRTRLAEGDLARLGLETGTRLNGPMALKIIFGGRGAELQQISVAGDLSQATLDLSELGWNKPAEIPATLSIDASAMETGWRLENIRLTAADGAEIAASAILGQDASLQSLTLQDMSVGATTLSGHVARTGNGGLHVVLSGPSIDLRELLGDAIQAEDGSDKDPLSELSRFALDLRAARAIARNGVEFIDLSVNLVRVPERWQRVEASAVQAGGGARLSMLPTDTDEAETRRFTLTSENAGNLMLGLGLLKNVEGGVLDLQADLTDAGPTLGAEGVMTLRDFLLVVPEEELAAEGGAEDSGLQSFVGDGGIHFNLAELPFKLKDGIYDIDNARANGSEIGLTMEGQVDRNFGRLNVNGVIVPAYWFNSLLGNIPLIGGIFSGGEGGGLFAMSYRVEGRLPEPKVSVNPMTAIMPGILRRPFEGSKGRLGPEAPETPETRKDTPPDP